MCFPRCHSQPKQRKGTKNQGEKEKEGKGREKDTEKGKEKKKKAPRTPPMYRHWKPIPNNGLGPADVGGSSLEKDPTHPPMASSKGKRIPCRRTSTDAPAQNVTMNIVLPPAAFKTEAEEGNEDSGGEREGGEGKGAAITD